MRISDLKLNILFKGLILLLVPFALQAALFILLFTQISSAEKLSEQQRVRTDIVEMTSGIIEDFGMAWISIFSHMFGSEKWAQQNPINPEDYKFKMDKSLAELSSVPELSARMKQIFVGAESIGKSQYKILKKVDEGGRGSDLTSDNVAQTVWQFYALKHDLAKTFAQMNAIKREINLERGEMHDARIQDEQKRTSIKQLSIFFLLFEILLTGILLAYFLNDISKRLNELVSNARRLPEEAALSNRVSGSDEIAYLDFVLHEASEKLLEAKQNRQSILNMITHDIRSPLMSSNLMLDSLIRKAEATGDSESKETSERLKQTYSQVILLVEDLLALEKTEAKLNLNPQLLDINQLCQNAIESVSPQAEAKGIIFSNSVTSTQVIVDKMRILQVLNNILTNAVKYSKNDSTISLSSTQSPEFIKVSIKDAGVGIAPDEIPHLFDKFFQSRNSLPGQGFGLGLAIAKMVVESHGGSIGADSQLGQGSTFWFSLPLDEMG